MKKTTLGIGLTLVTLGIIGTSASTALAYKGDSTVKGPNYSLTRHAEMTKIFADKNYDAWKKIMEGKGGKSSSLITKENFAKFAEAHALMLQGKTVEAKKIQQELGLGLHNGSGAGMGKMGGKGQHRINK